MESPSSSSQSSSASAFPRHRKQSHILNNKNVEAGNSVMAMGAKSLFGRKVRNALKRMSTLVHKPEKSKSIFAERKNIVANQGETFVHYLCSTINIHYYSFTYFFTTYPRLMLLSWRFLYFIYQINNFLTIFRRRCWSQKAIHKGRS